MNNNRVNFINASKNNRAKILMPLSLMKGKRENKQMKLNQTNKCIGGLGFGMLKRLKELFVLSALLILGISLAPTAHGQQSKDLNVVPIIKDSSQDLLKRLLTGKPSIDVFTNDSKLTIEEVKAVTLLSPRVANAVRNLPGCTTNTLPRNDDGSTRAVTLPFSINFFGRTFTQTFVNNNGNITFAGPSGTFTPFGLTSANTPIVAPFFADVDTRNSDSGVVQYGNTTVDGHQAFCVNYINVGYFPSRADKLNTFQVILIDRENTGTGNFDIEFNYNSIQWETGNASGGSNGLGGRSARAGYANGTRESGTFFELPGSAVNGGLLDTNQTTGLTNTSRNSDVLGRHIFFSRSGTILPPCTYTINPASANIESTGGSGSFIVTNTAGTNCIWTAESDASWLSTSSSGNGNGIVNYSVAENTTTSSRSGTIAVGGQIFTVTQDAPVTCSANPPELSVIGYGQSISSTLSINSCEPNTLFSDLNTFSGEAGDQIIITLDADFFPNLELIDPQGRVVQSVNGSTISKNLRLPDSQPFFTLPATGTYTIRTSSNFLGGAGDYTLSLYKAPSAATPCNYSVSPSITYVSSSGGTFFFDVLTQNGCPPFNPTADSRAFYSITSFRGGRVIFSVSPNTGATERQATITVAGQTHTIFQYGDTRPANDFFANAQQLPNSAGSANALLADALRSAAADDSTKISVNGYNTGATAEPNETSHAGSNAARSVWYRWTPAAGADGLYSFTTSGSSFDTVMDIYSCPTTGACSLSNIKLVGSNDNTTRFDKSSKVNFRAAVGTVYYIVVDGKNGASGTIQLAFKRYERLFRLYLQTFNGTPSPITPDRVTASNGSRSVPGAFISQGVYEFSLPDDKTVYFVNISGPADILWDPNNIPLNDSLSLPDNPASGERLNAPSDDPACKDPNEGEQNVISNATYATPRFITGYIKNITEQERMSLSVKIGFALGFPEGAISRDAEICKIEPLTIRDAVTDIMVPYIRYQCRTQPNTLNDIIPNMFEKTFKLPVKSFPDPIDTNENGLPSTALEASDALTYNISGQVLDGVACTIVELTYKPTGAPRSITLRTRTDERGAYEFKNLVSGIAYTVKATRTGVVFNQPPPVNLQADTTIEISLQEECIYTASGVADTIGAAGGPSQFQITTNNPTCGFAARRLEPWIVINSGATVGSGTVFFTVEPNTGAARTGTIRVQGQSIAIQQAGVARSPRKRPGKIIN